MNVFFKAYCRAFQTAFRLALPVLPYRKPEILSSMPQVLQTLTRKGVRRVLLVTDKGIRGFGITGPLEKLLTESGISAAVYDSTAANPTTDDVARAKQLYLQHRCEAIIGFGGGSSIDCAKAVGACIARPHKPLAKMEGILKVLARTPLLVAIPTTAGTGSETTLAAVITDSVTRHKYPINDFPLIPRYAVLNPETTVSLPPHLTATTGMDALTHAVEAYIGRSTTRGTRADALLAVKLIFENIHTAYSHPQDLAARENMLLAAYHAGNAFTRSYVGYVHAVAHSLGGKYNVPHGLANAVLLPDVLESYGAAAHKKLHRLGVAAGVCTAADSDAAGAEKFIAAIRAMKRDFGIGDTIAGICKEDIPELARCAAKEANPLYPVPRLMNAAELERFYHHAMEDKTNDRD